MAKGMPQGGRRVNGGSVEDGVRVLDQALAVGGEAAINVNVVDDERGPTFGGNKHGDDSGGLHRAEQDFEGASVAAVPWSVDRAPVVKTETKLLNGVYVVAGVESDAGEEIVGGAHVGEGRAALAAYWCEAVNLAGLDLQGGERSQRE